MGAVSPPAKIPFTDINDLSRPGTPLSTYVLFNSSGQSTGQEFIWSDTGNDYIPVGDGAYNVIGTWDSSNNTPDYTTTLTTNGDALSVITAGTTNVNGFDKWNVGDLIVRDNDIFFRVPNQPDILSTLTENSVPIYKNNQFEDSSISEDNNTTMVDKELQPTPGSVIMGGVQLEELGGFAEDNSNISGRNFVVLDYQLEDSGSSDPIYFERQSREGQNSPGVKPRLDFPDISDNTQYNNLTTFDLELQTNSDIHAIYLRFRTPVTNFRFSITSQNSSRPVRYYPSQAEFFNNTGDSFPDGIQKLVFEKPTGSVSGVTLTVDLQADQDVNLFGNSSFPFLNVDRQLYGESTMVHNDNVAAVVGPKIIGGNNVTVDVDTNNNDITINSSGSGGGDFIPGDHSATEFNDVTSAGSGQIITDAERIKLNGIATEAEVNVQSDWDETDNSQDSFIQNKPTIPTIRTDEDIRDVMSATLIGGNGINITEDDINNTITISSGGSIFDAPRITNFDINIDSRIDLNTDLNVARTVTYDVMHSGSIQTITLDVSSGTNQMLTNPSGDVSQSQSVTLSGLDTSSESTLTFKITGTDTNGGTFESNSKTINIQNLPQQESFYYGVSDSNNPESIDVNSLTLIEVSSSMNIDANFDLPNSNFAVILSPNNYTISDIKEKTFNVSILSTFTKTDDVRAIGLITYDSFVHQNNAGSQAVLSTVIEVEV